jgi:hypothetical protein
MNDTEVVTIGETMTLFTLNKEEMLRHARSFSMKFRGTESNVDTSRDCLNAGAVAGAISAVLW